MNKPWEEVQGENCCGSEPRLGADTASYQLTEATSGRGFLAISWAQAESELTLRASHHELGPSPGNRPNVSTQPCIGAE